MEVRISRLYYWYGMVRYGTVWYGIFIFHRQYNVISKKIARENFTYAANENYLINMQ